MDKRYLNGKSTPVGYDERVAALIPAASLFLVLWPYRPLIGFVLIGSGLFVPCRWNVRPAEAILSYSFKERRRGS
jgi:hypothetical protein